MWNHTFRKMGLYEEHQLSRLTVLVLESIAAYIKLKHWLHTGEKQLFRACILLLDSPFSLVLEFVAAVENKTNDPFCTAACRLGDLQRASG